MCKRLRPYQNHYYGSKVKIAKKVPNATLQPVYSCCMQKRAAENNEWLKNEAILKIDENGQYAKAIAFAKSPLWVKN